MSHHYRHQKITFGALAALCLSIGAGACSSESGAPKPGAAVVLVANAKDPSEFATDRHGRILYAERQTGNVRRIDVQDHLEPTPVASVDTTSEGQRGLLGLAIDAQDQIFVAYTERGGDRRLTVSKILGRVEQVVWRGPKSEDLANGGHLAFRQSNSSKSGKNKPTNSKRTRGEPNKSNPDQLLIGIGELAGKHLDVQLGAPPKGLTSGRMLELDPAGPARQTPQVLSTGWHNPFAFFVRADGAVIVADNAPDGVPERLARADSAPTPEVQVSFDKERIPTAIAEWRGRLVTCQLTDSTLRRQNAETHQFSDLVIKSPCNRTVIEAKNRLVFATDTTIYTMFCCLK